MRRTVAATDAEQTASPARRDAVPERVRQATDENPACGLRRLQGVHGIEPVLRAALPRWTIWKVGTAREEQRTARGAHKRPSNAKRVRDWSQLLPSLCGE